MRTLGQVADYMGSKLNGSGQMAAAPVTPIAPESPSLPAPSLAPVASGSGVAAVPTPVLGWAPETSSVPEPTVASTAIATLEPPTPPVTAAPSTSNPAEMQTKLLEVVSDKTGYPAEMLELDMDMEADLGIDSIKRVEILGALQEAFPDLPQPNLEELAEIEMRTLGQVAEYMQSQREKNEPLAPTGLGSQEVAPRVAAEATAADPEVVPNFISALDLLPLTSLPLPRHPAQLRHLPPADWLDFDLPQGQVCLLTDDGSETTTQLAQRLSDQGWKVIVLSFPATLVACQASLPFGIKRVVLEQLGDVALGQQLKAIAATEGTPAAFIHLHPTGFTAPGQGLSFPDAEATLVKQVFFLAKHLKPCLNQAATQGRSVFMTVVRLDGSFGMGGHGGYSAIAAGLAGLTKTLNFEWRAVFCRAVDLNPALTPEQSVNYILAELHDPDGVLPETAYGERGRVALVAG
ncbi:MAG: hypothetical protein HC771_03205 [Synechococcales cyanobacterium CRU_2_2]|nr:hypothetical protein [Synechococcales cyanobacterium CRU_2_2]